MKTISFFFGLLLISTISTFADWPAVTGPPRTDLQDPQTKISYHLESDRRLITAISPEGKVLWCCAATVSKERAKICPDWHIVDFRLQTPASNSGRDMIDLFIWECGYGNGSIDMKTGIFTPGTRVE